MKPDLVVTTNLDTLNATDEELSLREALTKANLEPGPHRIIFEESGLFTFYRVNGGNGPLPPVPSLTYLDGGAGITLQAVESSVETGLILAGNGIVVSDILVGGFAGRGIKIESGASDVHLFRMRIGAIVRPAKNTTSMSSPPTTAQAS